MEGIIILSSSLSQLYLKKAPGKLFFHISYFLESEPANPFAFETRASVYQLMGQHALAVSDLRNMIALKMITPSVPEDYFQLSDGILANPGNYDEAIAACGKASNAWETSFLSKAGSLPANQEQPLCRSAGTDRPGDGAACPQRTMVGEKGTDSEMNGQPQEAYVVYQQARTEYRYHQPQAVSTSPYWGSSWQKARTPPFASQAMPGDPGYLFTDGHTTSMTIKWRTDISTDSKYGWYPPPASRKPHH